MQVPPECLPEALPRFSQVDVVIDSANRDLRTFPLSNDYEVPLPGGPLKFVRYVDLLCAKVPKTETTINDPPALKGYGDGNGTLFFNEGYVIDQTNEGFRFNWEGRSTTIFLPRTLIPVQSVQVHKDGTVNVQSSIFPNVILGMRVSLMQFFNASLDKEELAKLNTHYEVCECAEGSRKLRLRPIECTAPCIKGGSGLLKQERDQCAFLFTDYVSTPFDLATLLQQRALLQGVPLKVSYDPFQSQFEICTASGAPLVVPHLLGHGNLDKLQVHLPTQPYNTALLAHVLQVALNPPTIVADASDTLPVMVCENERFVLKIPPGTYTPETLAHTLQTLLNEETSAGICVTFSPQQRRYLFANCHRFGFSLLFNEAPALAKLLGFYPLVHANQSEYVSDFPVVEPFSPDGCLRSSNLYEVTAEGQQLFVSSYGSVGAAVKSLEECDAGSTTVITQAPHGLSTGQVARIIHKQDSLFSTCFSNLFVVVEVPDATTAILGGKVLLCEEQEVEAGFGLEGVFLRAVMRPFNLLFGKGGSHNLAPVLGFSARDLVGCSAYRSDRRVQAESTEYILLQLQLGGDAEASQPRLNVQFTPQGSFARVFARLDTEEFRPAFDYRACAAPGGRDDPFLGKLLGVDKMRVKLLKPNGKLYDTKLADHSLVLRFIAIAC